MAPSIAIDELRHEKGQLTVVDPMAGSGTSIVAARLEGHKAIGFDIDPLAVLIAKTWAANVREDKIRSLAKLTLERANRQLKRISQADSYPDQADEETRKFVRFWFDPVSRRQLTALRMAIQLSEIGTARDVLWCAFSRMIVTKSEGVSLAMDVSHSRPHKVYARSPRKPFEQFPLAIERILQAAPFKDSSRNFPSAKVSHGDARSLRLPSASADIVITSPPYLNAIDYLRGHRMALVWMGHQIGALRRIRSGSIGSENMLTGDAAIPASEYLASADLSKGIPSRLQGVLAKYAIDMCAALSEIVRVLKPNGRLLLVIGDSTTHGTFISTSGIIRVLADRVGLKLTDMSNRALPDNRRYLPPPDSISSKNSLGNRMRSEVILKFRHTAPKP